MTKQLVKKHLSEARLDQNHYLESLLHAAFLNGIIDEQEALAIQTKLLLFVQDFAKRFVGGMSSSLPLEHTQSLARSAFYQISFALQLLKDPENALYRLRFESFRVLQHEGLNLIKYAFAGNQNRLERIQYERIKIPLQAYQDTIMSGIPLFFNSYDIEYAAHETPGSIDYPLTYEIEHQSGIVYIETYLKQLNLENQFLRAFSPLVIHQLLLSFDVTYGVLLINPFEMVLDHALAKILCHQNPLKLILTLPEIQTVNNLIKTASEKELHRQFELASNTLLELIDLNEPSLDAQIKTYPKSLVPRILTARKYDSLHSIWFPKARNTRQSFTFSSASNRMSTDDFRKLSDEIRVCRYTEDKIRMTRRHFFDPRDLIDLLDSHSFFEDEYHDLFSSYTKNQLHSLKSAFENYSDHEWHSEFIDIFRKKRHTKQRQ